jgi:hypothetical protein
VSLGAGRVPERSVEVRVAEMSPSPVPHPPSSRTSPTTSPASTHAVPLARPVTEGPALGLLLAGTIGREVILDVRIDASPPDQRGQPGRMSRGGGRLFSGGDPPAASPAAGENVAHPVGCQPSRRRRS